MLTILRPKDKFVLPRTWRTSKHETNERREASFLSVLQTNVIRSDVFLLHLLIYLIILVMQVKIAGDSLCSFWENAYFCVQI